MTIDLLYHLAQSLSHYKFKQENNVKGKKHVHVDAEGSEYSEALAGQTAAASQRHLENFAVKEGVRGEQHQQYNCLNK